MFRWLVIGCLAGLSLEEARLMNLKKGGYTTSLCYNNSSAKTCFAPFLLNNNHQVPKCARLWSSSAVPGSSLIVINIVGSQRIVEIFIGRAALVNKTIVLDAQKLSANVSLDRLWVNGNQTIPIDGLGETTEENTAEEDARKKEREATHIHVGACVESQDGQSQAYCVGYVKSQYRYICKYSDDAINPTDSKDASFNASSDEQCICISPPCKGENDKVKADFHGKWWSCNCNHSYTIVCHKVEEKSQAITKKIADTEKMLPSTSSDFTSSPSLPGTTGDTASIPSMDQEPSPPESDEQETGYSVLYSNTEVVFQLPVEQTNSIDTTQICLILLLFVAVIFIAVAVILIIRKRKHARRYETSPLNRTEQNEAVPRGCEIMVRDNRPSGDNIYTESEMTQQPTPSNNTTYASIQPTSEVVDMGKSVDYTDIDFPLKDQQKPKSDDKGTVSVSPIYSQPLESPTSASNTDYVEPYKPDKALTATAPVQSQHAAGDQQNVYSLAKAIPSGDPNVIYSEPNKPKKSSTPTGKAVKVTDPVYQEAIEVKPGAESGDVAKQDPSAVYAEPIKLKKSS